MLKINKAYNKKGEQLTSESRLKSSALAELLTEVASRDIDAQHE